MTEDAKHSDDHACIQCVCINKVAQVACGTFHSLVVTEEGELFSPCLSEAAVAVAVAGGDFPTDPVVGFFM